MNFKHLFHATAIFCTVVVFSLGSFVPSALGSSTVSIASDTATLLSGPGITLILDSDSSLVSYSANATTLTVNLDANSIVTVKSNNLYTLANSQNNTTHCSASPAYSYITFSATGPESVTITPTIVVACSNTAPVIGSFAAVPTAITSGQTSVLSWSLSGADTVSIDNGIGPQSNASSCSASVAPFQTTIYTLTATNYIGTTTAQTTVTVTAPPSGGGGGGSVIAMPNIGSFIASPASILAGQSSSLSWNVSSAARLSITPAISAGSLNPQSSSATVTPASTTTYTLIASNLYGQSVTATTTVTVLASTPLPPSQPTSSPVSQLPSQSASSTTPTYCLVNHSGTFYLVLGAIRHGIANPGLLFSYGYNVANAVADTASYQTLPGGNLLTPNDGALVKSKEDPTVYLISNSQRYGFTSVKVFAALGFKFSSVLTVTNPELQALPKALSLADAKAAHLPGIDINDHGTIYRLGADLSRQPYPSLAAYNSWHRKNDFSQVVPANAADLSLPLGPAVTARSSCGQ